MAKSYYALLGISSMATTEEIRAAYRRLAKAYHPDRYSGSSDSFRQIQEAYNVLGNVEKRRQYESQISRSSLRNYPASGGRPQPEPLIPEEKPTPLGDISPMEGSGAPAPFGAGIFDWFWNNVSSLAPPRSGSPRTLTLEVPISRIQASHGGNATIVVRARARCPLCNGYGAIGFYACHRCDGEGAIVGEVPVTIAFPQHMRNTHTVMLPLDRYGLPSHHLAVIFRVTGQLE
ncbi:DnaJ domain-containing protein [Desulfosarcina sp.]|uniref:DnaJ domain-containing protein n=1 Tax=Desulfosarcina sp. TaxID=2027861 RepID=UPI003970C7A2